MGLQLIRILHVIIIILILILPKARVSRLKRIFINHSESIIIKYYYYYCDIVEGVKGQKYKICECIISISIILLIIIIGRDGKGIVKSQKNGKDNS